jgi:hypothetical protein
MMQIQVEVDQNTLKKLLLNYLAEKGIDVDLGSIDIQVKSKQNFGAEWETAQFRAFVKQILH